MDKDIINNTKIKNIKKITNSNITPKNRLDERALSVFFDKNGNSKNQVNLYEKSTTERKNKDIKTENIKTKKYKKNKLITAIVASVVISASLSGVATATISNSIDQIEFNDNVDKALKEYKDSINNALTQAETYETLSSGIKGKVNGYQGDIIANEIIEKYPNEKDQDIAVFTLYDSYSKSNNPIHNNIVNNTVVNLKNKDNKNYTSFENYLKEKGFSNEEEYQNKMSNFIVDEHKYKQSIESIGGKQWK